MLIIGVDTGGTFTDFIYNDGQKWDTYKCLSTPANPAKALIHGIVQLAGERPVTIAHGSTVATNAILERKGAKTALITNQGFEDVLEIGRQNRRDLYQLFNQKTEPLIPARHRFGLPCRVTADGNIIQEPAPSDFLSLAQQLKKEQIESIAVCFLFSFNNSAHEQAVREHLAPLRLPISLSHEILSEFREYERTTTTALNAYVWPKMGRYLTELTGRTQIKHLHIMQSNGGKIQAKTAIQEPIRTILSGPAGGVVGAFEIGKAAGYNKLITFDMGGTSTDVALIDSQPPLSTNAAIAGFPVKVPTIDIHTVGAGGGSIAHYDIGGSLKVGPKSAGADPGPICYGKGEQITVTDANLLLGRLLPNHFLGGHMTLQRKRIEPFFESMAHQCGLSVAALAEGIVSVANTAMERAIRLISVERGHDPREFTLFSFGGAGGMHAMALAGLLGIPRVLVPENPGILSAMGMLMADTLIDYSKTVMAPGTVTTQTLQALFRPMASRAENDLAREGIAREHIHIEPWLDMRYRGQAYEIMVPFDKKFIPTFHTLHQKTYGYANPKSPVEIVNIRLRARGASAAPVPGKRQATSSSSSPGNAMVERQPVRYDGKWFDTPVFKRALLLPGHSMSGPAVIVEYSSTIVIPPNAKVSVDAYGNLVIDIGKDK